MIQITRKANFPIPDILLVEGHLQTQQMKAAYEAGERVFKINNNIYGQASVKNLLIKIQDYKCCFCEARIGHIDDGDVEHFRPKQAWRQSEDEPLQRPGYYWLAYDWDNLFLACTKCNGRKKVNLFPLLEDSVRALSHMDILNNELTAFIHPALENPADYIGFVDNIPVAIDGNVRGQLSIKYLGLDRALLNKDRAERLDDLKDIFSLVSMVPKAPPELRLLALQNLQKHFAEKTKDSYPYAGMFRAFFASNPLPIE